MALRRGLGKGVDSLIPTAEDRKAAKKPAADKPKRNQKFRL